MDINGPDINGDASVDIPEGNLEIDAKGKVKAKKPKIKTPKVKGGAKAGTCKIFSRLLARKFPK